MFDGEPLNAGKAVALRAGAVDVEVLERVPVLQQLRVRFTVGEGWLREFGDPTGR